ncbi:hypothetical protein ACFQX6_51655 [Streptosporangium lutulentum]
MIGQDNVALVKDETYEYSFFGIATPGRVARALVQLPVDPYTQFLSANPELSVSGNDYSYTFTSPVDLPTGQVVFQLGGSATPGGSAWTTSPSRAVPSPRSTGPTPGRASG